MICFKVGVGYGLTISLKRSTQNLQLSTSWPADYPSIGGKADLFRTSPEDRVDPKTTFRMPLMRIILCFSHLAFNVGWSVSTWFAVDKCGNLSFVKPWQSLPIRNPALQTRPRRKTPCAWCWKPLLMQWLS